MIRANHLTKIFDDKIALDDVNLEVLNGSIYGLVGTNGSGKTTLLKHITGIYMPTGGEVVIDDEPAFENEAIKQRVCFIPDDLYFLIRTILRRWRRCTGVFMIIGMKNVL